MYWMQILVGLNNALRSARVSLKTGSAAGVKLWRLVFVLRCVEATQIGRLVV